MARILIPTPLRQFADKHDSVDLPGATVGEVLTALIAKFPELKKHLYNDEGKLRSFVNVYLNDEDIRYMKKEATPVNAPDTLSIVPSIAGGKNGHSKNGDRLRNSAHRSCAKPEHARYGISLPVPVFPPHHLKEYCCV